MNADFHRWGAADVFVPPHSALKARRWAQMGADGKGSVRAGEVPGISLNVENAFANWGLFLRSIRIFFFLSYTRQQCTGGFHSVF